MLKHLSSKKPSVVAPAPEKLYHYLATASFASHTTNGVRNLRTTWFVFSLDGPASDAYASAIEEFGRGLLPNGGAGYDAVNMFLLEVGDAHFALLRGQMTRPAKTAGIMRVLAL